MTTKLKNYYDKKYFLERDHVDIHMAEAIKIFMKENKLKHVLDVGCGTGRLVKFLNENGFDAKGCDNQEEAVKYAKRVSTPTKIKKGSATKVPFKTNTFDLVTAISVIEHLKEKQFIKFLKETKRVLRRGGFVFLVTPNYATPFRLLQGGRWFGYSDPTHVTFFTPKSLAQILKSAGFRKIKFRFKSIYDSPFDWDLPEFMRSLPQPIKTLITYLLISTPLSNIRNSFWIAGRKV